MRPIIAWCLTALGVGFILVSACATQPITATSRHGHAAPASPRPPVTLERLVAAAGCPSAKAQGKAADFRQVVCQAPQGRYTIMTFDTQTGRDAWLAEAEPYGGTYLVGERWAVVSEKDLLHQLRDQLGGELRGQPHGAHS
ncbi:hypothetical protein [Nonomuraea jiangxiensis]|uniref:hypothetical protein n=1 Tax=Nonomuraea jiangxiensis TaxID=633440 RepID=UPI000B82B7B0|nr:hypothetical protein [Nonomuraea jiangxiensis]